MANETAADIQMENDLKAALGQGSAPAKGAESGTGTQTPADTKSGVDASQPPANTPAAETPAEGEELSELDKTLKALDELDKKPEGTPAETPTTPVLSEEQTIILKHIPDAASAERLVTIANNHTAFEEAFAGGDFERVDGMFTQWNPQAYDAFKESMYQKFVASGEWVERFINEKDAEADPAKAFQNQKQSKLEKQVAELQRALQTRQAGEESLAHNQRQQQIFNAYEGKLNELFKFIGVTEAADIKFIKTAINADVKANKQLIADINAGRLDKLVPVFKANANAYLKRDQTFTKKTEDKINQQTQHKAPISGGGGTPTNTGMPENVKDVKRGEETNWMVGQLGKLFANKKK